MFTFPYLRTYFSSIFHVYYTVNTEKMHLYIIIVEVVIRVVNLSF